MRRTLIIDDPLKVGGNGLSKLLNELSKTRNSKKGIKPIIVLGKLHEEAI